ncbi:hypothetical protein [Kitasatospora sp. MMS16-BH015]|uniref:hypothetical protein n=1 Tax=Kitasatospora sp. MMS16-BH015 TaxID=2018025 RepID=UPI000CF2CF06|nr:hypothetical protein [Kitasatospora sp. MMS16-BH015]
MVWSLLLVQLLDVADPQVQRDKSGGVSSAKVDSVFDLKAGDCFTVRSRTSDGGIQWVLLVPCDRPHDGQVYATPPLPKDAGDVEAAADAACAKARPAGDASYGFLYPAPELVSQGHGRASCYLTS